MQESLATQIRETRNQIKDNQKALQDTVKAIFSSLKDLPKEELTQAAAKAGLKVDFGMLVDGMERDNREIEEERRKLLEKHGAPDVIQSKMVSLNESVQKVDKDMTDVTLYAASRSNELKDFDAYASRFFAGKESATPENAIKAIKYCTTFGWGRIFTPLWWQGRSAVNNFQSMVGSIPEVITVRNRMYDRLENSRLEKQALTEQIDQLSGVQDQYIALDKKILSEDKVLSVVHDNIIEALFEDDFVEALSQTMGKEKTAALALPILKIVNLQKIENNLSGIKDNADATLKKLQTPLSKLRKGSSRAGSKSVNIDLDKVEEAIAGQERWAKYNTDNAQGLRRSINNYSYSPTRHSFDNASTTHTDMSMTNMLMMWMTLDASTHDHCDQGYVDKILNDDHAFIMPDVDVGTAVDGTSLAFNDVSVPDMPNVPDVPKFDVPSIPDISVPDVSSYSPSPSSWGDSGGSFSSGGGDGGGGGF